MSFNLTESLIAISIVGLIAGFIFSIPVAGPTSIVITSNALKGRTRYCNHVSIGASLADFVYVFIAVFGLTKLYTLYKPFIPYVLIAGSLFVIYIGFKISKTKIDIEHIDESNSISKIKNVKDESGFWTGILLGFVNPTLFIGWMTSSFIVLSLLATLGFNTGGLDKKVSENLTQISHVNRDQSPVHSNNALSPLHKPASANQDDADKEFPKNYPLLLSLLYAFFISAGSVIWFYYMSLLLSKFRHRINANIIHRIIQGLGFALCFFGLFLGYKGISLIT